MTPPRSLQELLDIEAIKQLKADYFYLMDMKQWDEWRELFTEDFTVAGAAVHEGGRDAFVDFVREHLTGVSSCHAGSMPVIEMLGETSARGRWSMSDDLRLPAGHPWAGAQPTRRLGYGYYDEEYRREGDTWRISWMQLSRLRVWSVPDEAGGLPA